jgi:hypothetical protein
MPHLHLSPSHIWTYRNAYIRCCSCAPSKAICNFFACIILLVFHSEIRHNLLRLAYVFWQVMLCWDEINNELHDIIVALIREVVL